LIEMHGDGVVYIVDPTAAYWLTESVYASEDDWWNEYIDMEMSLKIDDDIDAAIEHVDMYSTRHTEVIVTENLSNADRYVAEVDAAVVMVNASSRFTDGRSEERRVGNGSGGCGGRWWCQHRWRRSHEQGR